MSYNELMKERESALYFPDFETKKSSRRWYQHDIDVIIYSNMFRKMQRKSQLLSIQDPVSRSRLIHTFEVVRIAKEISEKLGLNSELTEAIALAHDFGNVAYGKQADIFLQEKTKNNFKHEQVSALMLKVCSSRIIPDKYRDAAKAEIELNDSVTHIIQIDEYPYFLEVYSFRDDIYYICISPEVIDGVIKHGIDDYTLQNDDVYAFTLEGQVVNYADNIAYLIQDISDFESTGIFNKQAKSRYKRCLSTLEDSDNNQEFPISGIVGETTSLRTATLIERFIEYNAHRLKNNEYRTIYSKILKTDIPLLEIEPIVKKAIDCCWNFKKEFYNNDLIKVSNNASRCKMEQIWTILKKNSNFVDKNTSYINFLKTIESPIFETFKLEIGLTNIADWENWKKAFFISHLTCDEIDLIINSFMERDYLFDLSLPILGSN